MQKYIAFGLYRKNEAGGHQEVSAPRQGAHVYLAEDVDRAVAGLKQWLSDNRGESQFADYFGGYAAAVEAMEEKLRELMVGSSHE